MKKPRIAIVAVVLLLICSIGAAAQQKIKDLKPTVILISLDGFRYDYLDKYAPPTLTRIAREGVRAKWMTPSFRRKLFQITTPSQPACIRKIMA
jgi:predicted AlkP superfamily pyrophosphatase or phosphodiesterase